MKRLSWWGAVCLAAVALGLPPLVAAQSYYKWVDEAGVVHYSDKVPPEFVGRKRAVVNKQGITVKVTEAARTKEELAEQERLAKLRAEQERIAQEQMARDQVLLRTFSTEQDLLRARDAQIASVETVIVIAQSNLKGLRRSLDELTSQAAARERSAQPVPAVLRQNIESNLKQIETTEDFIRQKRAEQAAIRAKFAADLARFRQIHAMLAARHEERGPEKPPSLESLGLQEADGGIVGIATCKGQQGCDRAWSRAEVYVRTQANMPLQLVSDTLIRTLAPDRPDALGISVARFKGNDDSAQLVLDVVCQDSAEGESLCRSPRVQAIKDGFKLFVHSER